MTLARAITDAQPGERAGHRNDDRLAPRRANLVKLMKDEAQAVRHAFKAAKEA